LECDVLFLGFGPITHEFVKKLTSNGHKVIAVSDTSAPTDNKAVYPLELFQTISWSDALKQEIKSQSTYICWRQSPKNRILGPELLNWVKSANLKTKKIHHLSSASVYKGKQAIFSEGDFDFRNSGSNLNSKQELEKLVSDIHQLKQTAFINYRISNVYGTSLTRGFIPETLKNLKDNQPVRIYKKIDLVRDYLFIDDLVGALFDLRLNKGKDEVLNISTGHGVAISEVVKFIELSTVNELEIVEIDEPLGTLSRSVLSCKKLEETITWKPQPLNMTIDRLLQAWF
jgi:nucleoside-diphosphate-sugar epimerase